MARDYKSRPARKGGSGGRSSGKGRSPRRPGSSGRSGSGKAKSGGRRQSAPAATAVAPGWQWLLTGLGLGLLVAAGVFLYYGRPELARRLGLPHAQRTVVSAPARAADTAAASAARTAAGSRVEGAAATASRQARAAGDAAREARGDARGDRDGENRGEGRGAQAGNDPADEGPREYAFYDLLPRFEVVINEEETAVGGRGGPRGAMPAAPVRAPGTYVLQVGSFRNHADADRMQATLALQGIESRISVVTIDGNETWHRVRIGPIEDLAGLDRVREQLRGAGVEPLVLRVGEDAGDSG